MIGDYDGIADGDVAIHFNFRPDRRASWSGRSPSPSSTSSIAAIRRGSS